MVGRCAGADAWGAARGIAPESPGSRLYIALPWLVLFAGRPRMQRQRDGEHGAARTRGAIAVAHGKHAVVHLDDPTCDEQPQPRPRDVGLFVRARVRIEDARHLALWYARTVIAYADEGALGILPDSHLDGPIRGG